jgi:4-amino-4-deoxy-L-arabinose transferase-like glycosyltransferase
MNTRDSALSIPLWLVWLAAIGFIFVGLGSPAILDNNEGLYAEIPREMLASHDWHMWIIPHLNGLPYMEKPPLLYWLTALSFSLFGVSEWSARLVPALSSLGCVVLLLWFGRKLERPMAGRLAALMFVSGLGVTAMSRVLMFDMLLTVMLTAALMHACLYLREEDKSALRKSYAFLALALMAKGLIALVLFGLVVLAFLALTKRSLTGMWRGVAGLLEPCALVIFFAIAVPWHVAASLTEPIFAWFYFINEHVLRFLGKREPHDYYSGSWWYYLPRMVLYLFPWSFLFLGLPFKKKENEEGSQALRRFLLLAWLMPLLFFSISSAKANYYLVAVMPFAAFHLALALEQRGGLNGTGRALPGLVLALLIAAGCAIAIKHDAGSGSGLLILGLAPKQFIFIALAGLSGLALVAAVAAAKAPRIGVLAYLALPLWMGMVLMAVLLAMEPQVSTRQTAAYLESELPGRAVYLYRNFEEQSSLPFYLKHPVGVIDSRSNDLFWGNKLQPNDLLISEQEFAQRLMREKTAVVVLERHLKDFEASRFFPAFKSRKRIGNSYVFGN